MKRVFKKVFLTAVIFAAIACGGDESPNNGTCTFNVSDGNYTVEIQAPCYCHWWLIDDGVDEVTAEARRLECIDYGIYKGDLA